MDWKEFWSGNAVDYRQYSKLCNLHCLLREPSWKNRKLECHMAGRSSH